MAPLLLAGMHLTCNLKSNLALDFCGLHLTFRNQEATIIRRDCSFVCRCSASVGSTCPYSSFLDRVKMAVLLTSGQVAVRLGVTRARLDFALRKSEIHEDMRAGILRLYSPTQLPEIEAALNAVRSRKGVQLRRGGDVE